jgi:hypothetical protein
MTFQTVSESLTNAPTNIHLKHVALKFLFMLYPTSPKQFNDEGATRRWLLEKQASMKGLRLLYDQ